MSAVLRSLLAAGVVTTLAVVGGVLLTSPTDDAPAGATPTTAPVPTPPTPLADYDTTTVTVQRAPFCDLVAPDSVTAALGSAPTTASDYANGDAAPVTDAVTDIAHEYGCSWGITGVAGVAARAWVFAPPVTRGQARLLVRDAARTKSCTRIDAAPGFGSPSVGLVCTTPTGLRTSYRGLFGDAWLACSLDGSLPRDEAVERTGELCVAVAQAASTPGP